MAFAVRGVGGRRQVAAVNRRAPGGIGDERPIAEQLREQFDVRRLAAAGAGARVFEERLQKLRVLDVRLDGRAVDLRQVEKERVVGALGLAQRPLRTQIQRLVLRVGLVLGRADADTQAAAGAVLRRDLNRVFHPGELLALEVDGLEGRGLPCERFGRVHLDADRRVRTDERALVALDAEPFVPDRDIGRQVAFLPLRRADRPRTVGRERAHGQQVSLAGQHRTRDVLHKGRRRGRHRVRRGAASKWLMPAPALRADARAYGRPRRSWR